MGRGGEEAGWVLARGWKIGNCGKGARRDELGWGNAVLRGVWVCDVRFIRGESRTDISILNDNGKREGGGGGGGPQKKKN
jgi:hypothetical protein